MAKFVELQNRGLEVLRRIDSRLVSYNIEMTEITGGTFWKPYTDAQIDGTEEVPINPNWRDKSSMTVYYDPIDLYNPRLRKLAKELGSVWVRVSGTWANKTYYDFDGHTNGEIPDGFQNLLTKERWTGVLEFIKHIDGKLLISVANCQGIHGAKEPWTPEQAKVIFDYSKEYGVPIDAVEFTNEPNMLEASGMPKGYTGDDYCRDHDLFFAYIRENYPETLCVGPCTVGELFEDSKKVTNRQGGAAVTGFKIATTDELIGNTKEKLDVFSYHYYNGVSERGAAMGAHWDFNDVLSEAYLGIAGYRASNSSHIRDKYVPGGQMWVTEAGDAGCGGNTWASTYADVPRTLNELGAFTTVTDGVIFHNTLASSDYGYLQHGTFEPRPNYFAVLLWNRLMGAMVYDCGMVEEGAHIFAHSRKDGKEGISYLVINNSKSENTVVSLPKEAEVYVLSADRLRSRVMLLNGRELIMKENDELPDMNPIIVERGSLELAPATCTFIVI